MIEKDRMLRGRCPGDFVSFTELGNNPTNDTIPKSNCQIWKWKEYSAKRNVICKDLNAGETEKNQKIQ